MALVFEGPSTNIWGRTSTIAADINIWWAEIRTSFPLVFFSRVSVKQALIQVKQALKRFK